MSSLLKSPQNRRRLIFLPNLPTSLRKRFLVLVVLCGMSGSGIRGGGFPGDIGGGWVCGGDEWRLLGLTWAVGLGVWCMSLVFWLICMGGGFVVMRC